MFKIVSLLLTFVFVSSTFSQQIIRPDGATNGILSQKLQEVGMANVLADPFRGQGFKTNDDIGRIEGNPLLFSEWKSGEVILKNGEKYNLEKINLDASRNQFIYSQNDSLFEFSDNIREVIIYDQDHKNDSASDLVFKNDINPLSSTFVQLLTQGKIIIFREYNKKPKGENYSNGIVNNTRKYVLSSKYYYLLDNKAAPFELNSISIENLTSDKKDQISTFMITNNLKVKKESDFLKAINYYNSISVSDK